MEEFKADQTTLPPATGTKPPGRRARPQQPDRWRTYFDAGAVLLEQARYTEAEAKLRSALAWNSEVAATHLLLGKALLAQKLYVPAETAFRNVVSLAPQEADAHAGLGSALAAQDRLADAEACIRHAISLHPDAAPYHVALGIILDQRDHRSEAIAAFQQALNLQPDNLETYLKMGRTLYLMGRLSACEQCYRTGLQQAPGNLTLKLNAALIIAFQGRYAEAQALMEEIIATDPVHSETHFYLSLTHFKHGDYENGWIKYEWRPAQREAAAAFTQPRWHGEPLNGRTVLVYDEQGLGDTLQFARFLPLVKQRGGNVIFAHNGQLDRLLQGMEGCDRRIPRHDRAPIPPFEFDVHVPLLSLPFALGIGADIPTSIPYLRVDPHRVQGWRERLSPDTDIRVGLVWAGNPEFEGDVFRSISLSDLAPLADIPGVRFYGLQKGAPAAQALHPPRGMSFVDLNPEINDFADTAAILMNLDLMITVDTAAAHLAGALGRPVWTLIPFDCDFRWPAAGDTTPWYPTMRLFRPDGLLDWTNAIMRVGLALHEMAGRCRR